MKILLPLLFVPVLASARIGETPEECAKRYGAGEKVDAVRTVYRQAGLNVMVTFWEGKAAMIFYSKIGKSPLGQPEAMSAAEQEAVLQSNSGGSKWMIKSEEIALMKMEWATEDGKLTAQHDGKKSYLGIMTAPFAKHLAAARKQREK